MDREILFKAKHEDNGEWVEGSLSIQNGEITNDGKRIFEYRIMGLRGEIDYVDPATVCQYTGLTDSNGKKIWENDIIRYADKLEFNCYVESLENPEDYEGYVYRDIFTVDKVVCGIGHDYPAFDLYDHQFDCNGLSELIGGNWHFEVIGNIFDNPELLEVKP